MNDVNIVVTGITGVGKTTIGKALAAKLNKEFIDLDKCIETHCGVNIQTIFAIEGEKGFRRRETEELSRTIKDAKNYVLSIGGGCVISQENRRILATAKNVVIQLYADVEVLVERLAKSATKRPLLSSGDLRQKIIELYEARKEYYDKITDLKVNTSNLKPVQIVEQIQALLNKRVIK